MNIEDGQFILTEELKSLIIKRKEIKDEKNKWIKSQKYEAAAKARDQEKNNYQEILNNLQKQNNVDFSVSKIIERDLFLIIDNIDYADVSFSTAIGKLKIEDLERMRLIKSIMQYNKGELTIDNLHKSIKNSFEVIKDDFKKKISEL